MDDFKNIFSGLERAHGATYVDRKGADGQKIKGKSFVQRKMVTDDMWENHLNGIEPSLGIIPIDENNKCKWGCVDIDSYAGFDHKKLINKIKQLNLPLVVFRSKSGGAHVFCFTTVPVEAKLMRDKLISVSAVLGYGGSEVFPKQRELKSKDDTGNFLNLPYFNGDNTVRYCFNNNAESVNLLNFFELYETTKITEQQLSELKVKRPETPYSDGPPCIELMMQNRVGEGGRNNALFHYGVYAKSKWPENWKSKLVIFNEGAMEQPLSDTEVNIITKQHDKKDWGYKCNDQPMCSLCDKKLCKKRKFGIGQEPVFPSLTDLQVVNLEEPYYYMNVDGDRLYLDSAKHLANQVLFQEECIKQLRINPPTVKVGDWKKVTTALLTNAEITEPAEGTSTKDILNNYLEDYCVNRIQKDDYEDLRNGGTYTKDGFHHFVFDNFFNNYLSRKHWRVPYQRTSQMLKDDLNCTTKRVGKSKISVFVVARFDKKTETYKPKTFKKDNY